MITAAKTNMQSMRPTDRAKVSRAMGKLLYQDEDLCVALVRSLIADIDESPPLAVAGSMSGLGQVAYRCWPDACLLRFHPLTSFDCMHNDVLALSDSHPWLAWTPFVQARSKLSQ